MKITLQAFTEELLQSEIVSFYVEDITYGIAKSSSTGKWTYYIGHKVEKEFATFDEMMAYKIMNNKTLYELLVQNNYKYDFA